jgi:FK506-binding protein 4/5
VKEKESWDLKDSTQKIEAATKKKDEGNVWFKIGKYVNASKRYGKVIV